MRVILDQKIKLTHDDGFASFASFASREHQPFDCCVTDLNSFQRHVLRQPLFWLRRLLTMPAGGNSQDIVAYLFGCPKKVGLDFRERIGGHVRVLGIGRRLDDAASTGITDCLQPRGPIVQHSRKYNSDGIFASASSH